MRNEITTEDESKPVRNADGERVGRVISVEDDKAVVDPEPGLTETFLSMLGWAEVAGGSHSEDDRDGDVYTLDSAAVETVTDEEVRLTEF